MNVEFRAVIDPVGVDVTVLQRGLLSTRTIPVAEWRSLPDVQRRAAQVLLGLAEQGEAEAESDRVRVSHEAAARLPASIADALNLPLLANLSATLSFDGRVDSPEGRIRVRWYDPQLRNVVATRKGAFLTWGQETGRLTASLLSLLMAIDEFNGSVGSSPELRLALWQPVQCMLHEATGIQIKDEYLKSLNIYQAGSFALDIRQGVDGPDFLPVLMSRAKAITLEDEAPVLETGSSDEAQSSFEFRDEKADALLPPELQRQFVERQFSTATSTHNAYVLGRNTFLVLDSDLKAALNVVRRMRSAPAEARKAFVRNPRPAIAEALTRDDADLIAALLFVETKQYSERVEGLAAWDPPKLPWLRKKAGQWLPETFPVKIGERAIQLTPESFEDLVRRAETARAEGASHIEVEGGNHPLSDVEVAISTVRLDWPSVGELAAPQEREGEPTQKPAPEDRHVLQVKTNFEGVEFSLAHRPRPNLIGSHFPSDKLAVTLPKPHQVAGFDWLVKAWTAGWPGVLLADDMGLGKTFQALAFLAWATSNQQVRPGTSRPPTGPFLVVAPTALLRTWAAEAELHLAPHALGERIDAFGSGLRRLKRPRSESSTPDDALDVDALRDAGWVLTTYETLADNHRAFARVAFSVAVFDEMQKIKAPGTINTHAAKAMNADFVIGLTGTPIENRLEDLWCIMDRIAPGYLGDLKSFSETHKDENPETLKALKGRLDQPLHGAPAIMLRRMKEEILEGLPEKRVETYRPTMPGPQADAYSRAVRHAQGGERTMGAMLKAIHALRGVSLHPDGDCKVDGYDPRSASGWVERSARVSQVVNILREIQHRDEKALVFIEDRAVQRTFAQAITTLFGLRAQPSIINGQVPGPKRQAIVDGFQAAPPGFAVLILSPKAAGIGFTLTAANHVVHLSRWWNPAVEDQCNDRIYRIGQTKPVTIHVPIALHPEFGDASFDVALDELLARKRALSRHMLAPPVSDHDVDELFGKSIGHPTSR